MAYIEPNTLVKIYHNMRLNSSYENTLYFASTQAQNNFFHVNNSAILKHTINRNSYQRVAKNKIRVELTEASLYDCNYMAFQNTSFSNKWFYAFIDDIEYVNNITCEITYTLDVIQTYLLDVTLLDCYIERQHVEDDSVGANIIDENLSLGEVEYGEYKSSGLFDQWGLLIQSPYNITGERGLDPIMKTSNVYNGNYVMFLQDWQGKNVETQFAEWIQLVIEKDQPINFFSMYPQGFINYHEYPYFDGTHSTRVFGVDKPTRNGAYIPHNNKLLTYPFCYFGVTNGAGVLTAFSYERFRDNNFNNCIFEVISDPNTASFMCVPVDYNNVVVASGDHHNYNYAITMDSIPMCSYNYDAYTVWIAQNKCRIGARMLTGIAGGAALMATGNPASVMMGVTTLTGSVMNTAAELEDKKYLGNQVTGTTGTALSMASGQQDFKYCDIHLNPKIARIVDRYFDMYGYAVHNIETPNIHARERWTFVKTNGCNVVGNAPSNDVSAICKIFDKGVRFWVNHNDIGNYGLTNHTL